MVWGSQRWISSSFSSGWPLRLGLPGTLNTHQLSSLCQTLGWAPKKYTVDGILCLFLSERVGRSAGEGQPCTINPKHAPSTPKHSLAGGGHSTLYKVIPLAPCCVCFHKGKYFYMGSIRPVGDPARCRFWGKNKNKNWRVRGVSRVHVWEGGDIGKSALDIFTLALTWVRKVPSTEDKLSHLWMYISKAACEPCTHWAWLSMGIQWWLSRNRAEQKQCRIFLMGACGLRLLTGACSLKEADVKEVRKGLGPAGAVGMGIVTGGWHKSEVREGKDGKGVWKRHQGQDRATEWWAPRWCSLHLDWPLVAMGSHWMAPAISSHILQKGWEVESRQEA